MAGLQWYIEANLGVFFSGEALYMTLENENLRYVLVIVQYDFSFMLQSPKFIYFFLLHKGIMIQIAGFFKGECCHDQSRNSWSHRICRS